MIMAKKQFKTESKKILDLICKTKNKVLIVLAKNNKYKFVEFPLL